MQTMTEEKKNKEGEKRKTKHEEGEIRKLGKKTAKRKRGPSDGASQPMNFTRESDPASHPETNTN